MIGCKYVSLYAQVYFVLSFLVQEAGLYAYRVGPENSLGPAQGKVRSVWLVLTFSPKLLVPSVAMYGAGFAVQHSTDFFWLGAWLLTGTGVYLCRWLEKANLKHLIVPQRKFASL